MSDEPLERTNEQRWWEMQLGLRLPRSIRHPSPIVRLDPPAARAPKSTQPDSEASPVNERHWWEKQLGKRVDPPLH